MSSEIHPIKKVAVVGSGPGGMIAGIMAARNGHYVTIFEKQKRPGMKLLVTGNGRCNISNKNISSEKYFGENSKFVESVFYRFSQEDTLKFFKEIGIELVEEDEGRLYPKSQSASDVLEALQSELRSTNCDLRSGMEVEQIYLGSINELVIKLTGGIIEKFDHVIITTGGRSYPSLGSNGSGFDLAQSLGHNIIQPVPASVPIRSSDPICISLKGVTLTADLIIDILDKERICVSDTFIFTHYGCSGPAVLSLSRSISVHAYRKRVMFSDIDMYIDFIPDQDAEQIFNKIKSRIEDNDRMISNQFYELCAKSLVLYILNKNLIDPQTKNISSKELRNVINDLKRYKLKIDGLLDWEHAQFTAGGIDTKEIDSKTMRSKLHNGLSFAGEVVDIDGSTGGYNLQWAWSSGAVAGMSI